MPLLTLFGQTSNDIFSVDTANATTDAVMAAILLFFIVFAIISYALIAFLLSRIFKKAGLASWKAWVPVYSTWLTLELGNQKGWWAVLFVAPLLTAWLPQSMGDGSLMTLSLIAFLTSIVGSVFLYIAMYKIGLKLGKEDYFVLWAIFLPIVWYAWLAFDKSTWNESRPANKHTSVPTAKA